MASEATKRWAIVLIAAGLVLVLAAQSFLPAAVVPAGSGDTGKVLGQTGFAYLGGLRTLVAALLWDRLDPQFHEYYGGSLQDSTYMMPTLRLVTWLDPQFIQAYYIAQWVVARRGDVPEALALTREGLAANPRSGLLRASYAQMLFLFAKDQKGAHDWAARSMASDATWASDDEKFQGYAILRTILKLTGDKPLADRAHAVWLLLKNEGRTILDTDEVPQGGGGTPPARAP
jgi:hypothetical protein